MSANCVLPPFDGMLTACSNEYFAGIALNELSECHSRLPMANSRRRSSRAQEPPRGTCAVVVSVWVGLGPLEVGQLLLGSGRGERA